MNTEVCICIPKIDLNINKHFIKKTFDTYKIGVVKKIHVIFSKDKKNKLAFIYFYRLHDNKNGSVVAESIKNEQDFKIIYSFPWFWKCYKAKT